MGWYNYYDSRDRKDRLQRKIEKLRKQGETFEALAVTAGRTKISTTFWGQAWCRHLESFSDYENRLPRGRSYLRQGNVYNLSIGTGEVAATVAGSELYDTRVSITPLAKTEWKRLTRECSGQVGSMLDLLAGRIGDDTLRVLTDREHGLFPKPRQMRFQCSCPDWADMCKHVAAVLYGVGAMLDQKPELLFVLRGVDHVELLGEAVASAVQDLSHAAAAGDDLAGADLSALFGIDLGDADSTTVRETPPAKPAVRKKVAKKKVAKKTAKKKAVAKRAAKKAAK
jgi:uncharacterized Zn finger protein